MICQICGKRTATTHVKSIVNGKLAQYHLCSECAKQKGYSNIFSDLSLSFGNLLGGLLGSAFPESEVLCCDKCGSSFEEITKTGKIGCPHCYETFRHKLIPVIQRIHGTTGHKGKTPHSSALTITSGTHQMMVTPVLDEKKRQLQEAIETQNYEQAAVLRDEIREMEKNG